MDSLPKPPTGYRWKIKPVGWGTKNFYVIKLKRFGLTVSKREFLSETTDGYRWVASEQVFRKNAVKAANEILDERRGDSLNILCTLMVDECHG
ncbi:hypothetical protein R2362_03215 [Mycobacteroides chelonae]|nr:hypothetical protein [Mycobacteroides chelonae]